MRKITDSVLDEKCRILDKRIALLFEIKKLDAKSRRMVKRMAKNCVNKSEDKNV